MKISLVQNNILWEDKKGNLSVYERLLSELSGKTDLVVLPEMCTTGFSMNALTLAEDKKGETLEAFRKMSGKFGFAIAGSMIGKDHENDSRCFNRGFFVCPDGSEFFYDKHHLFRMGDEPIHYQPGSQNSLISYLGWTIRLNICYDLRFPVWCRNVENQYDLLIFVANWPEVRSHAWKSLLMARAIENMAFVCGVNRVGCDGLNLNYSGDSQLINAYGSIESSIEPGVEKIQTLDLDKESLNRFRSKFPVWKDADKFELL